MARKIVLFWTILGLIFVIANYHFLGQKQPENAQKKITIFTLDTLIWIHTKMILWDRGSVVIGSLKNIKDMQKNLIKNSDIIIDTVPLDQSQLNKNLQDYKWTYVTVTWLPVGQILYNNDVLSWQITWIRDTLVEKDKTNPGYYYDSTGNYIHLIENLYESIQNRLSKYHKVSFITLWSWFDAFVEKFWLSKHKAREYNSIKDFLKDKWLKDALKKENIKHIFVSLPLTDSEIKNIEKNYHVSVYKIPPIEEDTSAWWYLRFVEKVADQFVRAFDTYD